MSVVLDPSKYSPNRSLPAKVKRRLTQWRVAKPMPITPKHAIVSFTFDDFPKSALDAGGSALDAINAKGTYFTCTGMAGMRNVMGELYTADDLCAALAGGHEIGAHTETHLDCSQVGPDTVRREISENFHNLRTIGATSAVGHFAWPYGETHHAAKRSIRDLVKTARGILPGINRKGSDLMQLRSCELTPDGSSINRAIQAIENAMASGGWVTIFTHDVRLRPSPFGTTPQALKRLTRHARDSGARVLPVAEAYDAIYAEAKA